MSEHKYIGKETARPDAGDKATGRAHYIHDIERPGMLFGKIKFSDAVHARIKHIDTARAEKLPGVRAVLTGANTPAIRFGFLKDNLALKRDKVRQYRDEVAAVAAIDPDIAAEAVDLIEVEYEPLPAVFDPQEALREGAPLLHETDAKGRPVTSNLVPVPCRHRSGDLDAGISAARTIVEGEFSAPIIQQSCMGTAGCIAEFDSNSNLRVWAKTQIPFLAQRDFNRALADMGLSGRNTQVIVPTLGGAFGTGLDTHAYEYISILLAYHTGRPVKIVYSRKEEFSCLSPRQSARTSIRQGCDAEGKLTFRQVEVLQDNGAYVSWGATYPTVMLLPVTSLYKVQNVSFESKIAYTNNTYCQAMRGYGNPEVAWAIESNLDDLAREAGIDPVELRLKNCNEPGETTPMGLKVTTCGLRECIQKTAAGLDWNNKRGKQKSKRRGVGMASLIHTGGGGRIYRSDATGMILKLDDFGNVNVYHGGVEMGQGLHSALTLAVAESLGVKPEQVFINPTDTGTCPWDVGTHASRGAFMACKAAILAAQKAREQIFSMAKDLFAELAEKSLARYRKQHTGYEPPEFDIASNHFELEDGEVFLRDAPDEPWLRIGLGQLLRASHFRSQGKMLTVESFYDPPNELPDWDRGVGNISSTYAYGAQGAEVEVDIETGEVKVLKMVAAHDVGKALNPQTLRGQIYGGLAQGIGYALMEEVLTKQGRILNPDFRDYKIPTAHELAFEIQLEIVETDDGEGPFGAKGVGEPGMVPTAPAIANAIYDAVGVRVYDLPITPERLLAALDAQAD